MSAPVPRRHYEPVRTGTYPQIRSSSERSSRRRESSIESYDTDYSRNRFSYPDKGVNAYSGSTVYSQGSKRRSSRDPTLSPHVPISRVVNHGAFVKQQVQAYRVRQQQEQDPPLQQPSSPRVSYAVPPQRPTAKSRNLKYIPGPRRNLLKRRDINMADAQSLPPHAEVPEPTPSSPPPAATVVVTAPPPASPPPAAAPAAVPPPQTVVVTPAAPAPPAKSETVVVSTVATTEPPKDPFEDPEATGDDEETTTVVEEPRRSGGGRGRHRSSVNINDRLLLVLISMLSPPVAVYCVRGCGAHVYLSMLLMFLPPFGMIHALYIIFHDDGLYAEEHLGLLRAEIAERKRKKKMAAKGQAVEVVQATHS